MNYTKHKTSSESGFEPILLSRGKEEGTKSLQVKAGKQGDHPEQATRHSWSLPGEYSMPYIP